MYVRNPNQPKKHFWKPLTTPPPPPIIIIIAGREKMRARKWYRCDASTIMTFVNVIIISALHARNYNLHYLALTAKCAMCYRSCFCFTTPRQIAKRETLRPKTKLLERFSQYSFQRWFNVRKVVIKRNDLCIFLFWSQNHKTEVFNRIFEFDKEFTNNRPSFKKTTLRNSLNNILIKQ